MNSAVSAMGGRWAHRLISAIFGQDYLDPGSAELLPKSRLLEAIQHARYYAWANGLRGLAYLPVVVGLYSCKAWFAFYFLVALMVFHALCVLAENHKLAAATELVERRRYSVVEPAVPTRGEDEMPAFNRYFIPKRIESPRLYEAIGVAAIKKVVNWYIDLTQLTKEERAAGKKAKHMPSTRTGMLDYETETRQAELMHGIAGAINFIPLAALVHARDWALATYVIAIIVLDLYLVLLQRFHRVRIYAALQRRRPGRSVPQG